MAWERLLKAWTEDKQVDLEGRLLSQTLQESYRQELQDLRRARLAQEGLPRMTTENLRNRVVIQEMRRVYNQLAGVGDYLLDVSLPVVLHHNKQVANLNRRDLEELNRDIGRLAANIFDVQLATIAVQRIAKVIELAFERSPKPF
jgi:hypothetical protein